MRHHKSKRKLGRRAGQRRALLRSLARSLILMGGITTTLARAKELRPFVEQLVTAVKQKGPASHRLISSRLGGASDAAKHLHDMIAPRFEKRSGGYTRIVRLGISGKRAIEAVKIEFV